MNGILQVLLNNILPIFLVAAAGFWLYHARGVEPRPIATVTFNVFSPCLVFTSLVSSRLAVDELARLALFTVLIIFAMGAVAYLVGRVLRLPHAELAVLLLTVMFVNGGNYGLTLNQLRYGDDGLARAVVYYVVSTMLVYTVGVLIATSARRDEQRLFSRLLRVPAFYAVILALVVYMADIPVPAPLFRAIEIAAAGAIPAMLLVLGMNLATLTRGELRPRLALPALSLRLVLAPLLAAPLAAALRLPRLDAAVAIVEASMPTAVITTVIATEFDLRPAAVTTIVVLSTLFSPLTLSLVIYGLGL